MTTKIAIITTKFLHHFIEEMLGKMQLECDFQILEYTGFNNISEIYTSLEDEVDGFMVSANVAQFAIEKSVKSPKKPIVWFGSDLVGLYQLLLELFIKNRNLDINRVIMDFLIPIRENTTCAEMVGKENLTFIENDMKKWLKNSTIQDLHSLEKDTTKKIITLWHQGKIDLSICFYSSIMPILQENGVPCIFAYPTLEHIKECINTLLSTIKINQMRENLPVVISVSKQGNKNTDDSDIDTVSLQKCLLDFNKENMTDFLIQKSNDGFDVYTSLRITNHITHFLEDCQLRRYLEEHLTFKVCIGYGIGNNIIEAKNNASDAKKEAILTDNSFIMDEKHNLIGPLNTEHFLVITSEITPEIHKIAEQSKLSSLTIQKLASIIKIMGTSQLTTQDLAARLSVTVRNANRILSNLEKSGFASILYNKSSNSKGRPIKVYEIDFPFKIE
ncbi:hypothetical protein [Clostridium sp.]|uniref:hypothetical protein n=1 Tax=Clostridium sp. TaxID=1506 RepID=UPI002FCC2729